MASPRTTYDRDQKHAVIDTATVDTTIVAAVTGKKILVTSYTIVASGGAQTAVRFESGTGGTALTGEMAIAANGQLTANYNPGGCFAPTAASALLNLQLGAATSVDGHVTYVEID
jgi:hypothetical protein